MDTVSGGKLAFTRLFFKKSKNRKGEICYISKVKHYENDPKTDKKKFVGDLIIIGNIEGKNKCSINKEGRWDVKCGKMNKGNGYVVVDAQWTTDTLEAQIDGFRVSVLINGKEEKLKTEDGKFIPLYFDRENYYEPEIIQENIERKIKFLQLPADFSVEGFFTNFHRMVEVVNTSYKKHIQENPGNTGIKQSDIDKLKAKWGN